MKIFYYRSKQGNLGDDLNAWLWEKVLSAKTMGQTDNLMVGIGTIIGKKTPPAARKFIVTSGVGYNNQLPDLKKEGYEVVAVRGPLSAKLLGLPEEKALTDGAILLGTFPEFHTDTAKRHGVVFMPHISAAETMDWSAICQRAGVEYLDPRAEHFSTLKRLGSAKLVLADAMHGAIIADALRVPWVPFSSSSEINTFKWLDWTLSLGITYKPTTLPARSLALLFRSLASTLAGHSLSFDVPTAKTRVTQTAINAFHAQTDTVQNLSLPRKFAAKVCYKLSRIFAATRLGRAPLWGKARAVRILRHYATQQGYQSDAKIAKSKLTELQKRLKATFPA